MKCLPYELGEKEYAASFPAYTNLEVIAVKLNKKFGNFRTIASVANMRTALKHKVPPNPNHKKPKNNNKDDQEKVTVPYVYVPRGKPIIKSGNLIKAMNNTDTSLFDVARVAGLNIESVRALVSRGGIPEQYSGSVRAFYEDRGVRV